MAIDEYLLGEVFHVLADEVVARGVEQNGETPWVSESDQMGLAGEEVDVKDAEYGDLLASERRLV